MNKKIVTVVLEVESDDDYMMTDDFIKNDLEQEINCASNSYNVVSITTVGQTSRSGKWKLAHIENVTTHNKSRIFYCSECNVCTRYPSYFCPNCGCRMNRVKLSDGSEVIHHE